MPPFPFQSLFTDPPQRRQVSGPGASADWRIKPTSLLDDDADPRFPAFQQAWQQGADLGELFGPSPFALHGIVAPSGGDNTRPDVAKVQTLLGKVGYLDLGQDGPSGYANPATDTAIRKFQKDKGLAVDGVLKPGGPTITALGGLLGGTTPASSTAQPKSLFGEFNESAAPQASIGQAEGDWMDQMNRPGWASDPRHPGRPTLPFGSPLGADRWAASSMANALLGRSDYQDAIKHFQGEIARDRAASMPHLAAVHEEMTARNPDLADRFATQMRAAGLTEEGQPPSREDGSSPDSGPGWYRDKDGRLVIIITKPGDGGNGTGSGQGGNGNDGGDQIPIDTVPGNQESKDNGQCRQLRVNAANAELHHKYTAERFHEVATQVEMVRKRLDDAIAKRDSTIGDALGSAAADCLAAAATAGATTKGKWPAKLSAAAIACIKANLKPEKGFDLGEILSHDDDVGQIERDLAEAVESQKLMLKELEAAGTAMQEAQGALSQAGCSNEGVS
jgi:hypothetical protein